MKNAIIILFLFFDIVCSGQVDTAYTSLRWGYNPSTLDSTWYETTTTIYQDGRVNLQETIAGDTTETMNYFINRAINAAQLYRRYANQAWEKENFIDFILQANGILSATFDTTIIQASVDLYGPSVDGTTWDISSDSGNYTGLMSIAQSGNNLIMTISATPFTIFPVGDAWIRFQGFPTGSYTDLHRVEGPGPVRFKSLDESLLISRQ